jgi:hypothetical protein
MDINFDRFLTITALLAAAGMTGCGTTSDDTAAGTGGTVVQPTVDAAAGNATPDSGAKPDAAPDQGAGDVSVESSTEAGAEASVEATPPCLGDDVADAGDAAVAQGAACNDLVFPSSEACFPANVCFNNADWLRPQVFAQMLACLKGVAADATDAGDACAAQTPAQACMDDAVALACPALSPAEGGAACADVVASCTPGNDSGTNTDGGAGITAIQCEKAMRPFTVDGISAIVGCYQNKMQLGDQACETIFADCVVSPSFE